MTVESSSPMLPVRLLDFLEDVLLINNLTFVHYHPSPSSARHLLASAQQTRRGLTGSDGMGQRSAPTAAADLESASAEITPTCKAAAGVHSSSPSASERWKFILEPEETTQGHKWKCSQIAPGERIGNSCRVQQILLHGNKSNHG
ncbi:hypothetical protein EYF80_063070 [Liparis tanakae]|uniref:Uncharacterized protein n=1 Tax=Liparis tanakae TaxID=230148 RepID=A0A4Z2EES3_9TELE|nr:hypothetical protein EYF80_063070 [Liparis tanakae]